MTETNAIQTQLKCTVCGAPASDDVGSAAVAYTCSRCLLAVRTSNRRAPAPTQPWFGVHTDGVDCLRCGERRWPALPVVEPFVCYRCRAVLAGKNAVDPVPSEAQRAAWKAAGGRLKPLPSPRPSDFPWAKSPDLVSDRTGTAPGLLPAPGAPGQAKNVKIEITPYVARVTSVQAPPTGSRGRFYSHGPLPPGVRWQVIERDSRRCRRCDTRKRLTVHHVTPRDWGGTDDPSNLLTLCDPCHNWAEDVTYERGQVPNIAELTCPPEPSRD